MEYYIQNKDAGYLGNSIFFWAKNSQGYTAKLEKAQKYSFEEAKKICSSRACDVAWPVEYIDNNEGTARVTDAQHLDTSMIVKF